MNSKFKSYGPKISENRQPLKLQAMETTEKTFVVTAFERAKGYRIRITLPATRKHAEKVAAKLTEEMETAIAKYQFFTDIRVEHMNKYIHS